MASKNDVTVMAVDAILSTPGMNDQVKIDLKMSRRNVLLFNHLIKKGIIEEQENKSEFMLSMGGENLEEIHAMAEECLSKAGLVETHEKLSNIINSK
jgi:hypothetical protein